MNRREFVRAAAPVTLTLLPSFSDQAYASNRISDEAFEIELRRRFEALPDFLKSESGRLNLAAAVMLLSQPSPVIKILDCEGEAAQNPRSTGSVNTLMAEDAAE